jgi:hypothetical protein
MTSVATITNTRFGLFKRLAVGAKTTFLLSSRSLKFMISVAMKIAIKSKNEDYELHYEA